MQLNKHGLIYHRLYAQVDGFSLSRKARRTQDALEYVYGEIDFISFIALMSLAKPCVNTVFYDLGSGVGKAVIACAMVFNVKKSCGIELFDELHSCALAQLHTFKKLDSYVNKSNSVQFIHGNFLTTYFNDATLVFINATGLFGDSWVELNKRLTLAKNCQTVITTSKKLLSDAFSVTRVTKVRMSWGIVNAYIQQRRVKD